MGYLEALRVLDENDQPASYAQLPLHLHVSGDAQLVGPTVVTAEGGMTGCFVRTVGTAGEAVLTVIGERMAPLELRFTIKQQNAPDEEVGVPEEQQEETENGTEECLAELQ